MYVDSLNLGRKVPNRSQLTPAISLSLLYQQCSATPVTLRIISEERIPLHRTYWSEE